MKSPFASESLFHLGPVPVVPAVAVTWGLMILLTAGGLLLTRRVSGENGEPSRLYVLCELLLDALDAQLRATLRTDPAPYRAFVGTLFLYVLTANWSSMVPGIEPPTATLETDVALGLIAFLAVIVFGIRVNGPLGYLKTFASPNVLLLPLNFVETLSRTLSLVVRLFGNVMSGVFIIGIVLSLAGLLVPIPLMALELLTGAIQAYIFAILVTVFIAGAIGREGH